jgi:plasmid stabilization system protein ParE
MSYNITFTNLAFDDYNEALMWYEEISLQTRLNFEKAVTERLNFISKYPEAAPVQFEVLRGVLVKKFKYKIYYRVFPNQNKIVVHAIAHTARDIDFIKERL